MTMGPDTWIHEPDSSASKLDTSIQVKLAIKSHTKSHTKVQTTARCPMCHLRRASRITKNSHARRTP